MLDVLTIVAPVFALILIGLGAGRARLIGPEGTKALSDFTFKLAVPALLFRTVVYADPAAGAVVGLWGSFFGAAALVWAVATLATLFVLRRPAIDAPSISMTATFGNVVMLGLPLAVGTFGPQATEPLAMIISLHTPLMWLAAAFQHALVARFSGAAAPASEAGEAPATVASLLRGLAAELGSNPIILAIIAGTLWRVTGLGVHPVPDRVLALLADASVPTALVSLGLSLVDFRIKGQAATLATVTALKIVAMPAAAFLLATYVFQLPPLAAGVVVLLAAMPTGANAFIFASRTGRAMNSAAGAVALGTVLSALTAAAIVYLLGGR